MTSRNLKNFEFKLGKLGLTIFITGMSILLFSVFILGVFIGRDIDNLPGKIATDITGNIKDKSGSTPANADQSAEPKPEAKPGTQEAAMERQPELNLTFYDSLKKKKEEEKGILSEKDKKLLAESRQNSPATTSQTAQKAAPASTSQSAENRDKKSSPSEKKAADKAAASKPEQRIVASPTAKALDAKGFVVSDIGTRADKKTGASKTNTSQTTDKKEKKAEPEKKFQIHVASYKEKAKAELIGKKVKLIGYKPRIAMADLGKKGKWYRVVVDGFDTKEKAQKAAKNISNKIKGTNCIIQGNGSIQKAAR